MLDQKIELLHFVHAFSGEPVLHRRSAQRLFQPRAHHAQELDLHRNAVEDRPEVVVLGLRRDVRGLYHRQNSSTLPEEGAAAGLARFCSASNTPRSVAAR